MPMQRYSDQQVPINSMIHNSLRHPNPPILDSGGSVDVAISDGTYSVQWINAQNTDDRKDGSTTTDGKSLTAPDYGNDWLLYLTRL